MGEDLIDLMVWRAVAAVAGLSPEEAQDTYAVSFWVNDDYDDPRVPVLTIGTNTEARVRAAGASSAAEARWNFAYWLHDDLAIVGGDRDPQGRALVDALFDSAGLRSDGEDFSPEALAVDDQMTETFVSCCLEAARRLHEHGGFLATFGRDLPVLVHELEYYRAIAEQNTRCNPPELVAGFTRWIDSMES